MNRERPLTEPERRLCDTLAPWLFYEMQSRLEAVSPAPDLLWDCAQSNFEFGCDALSRFGILQPEGLYWRVIAAPGAGTLSAGASRLDLDALLDALVCHSSYVVGWGLLSEVESRPGGALSGIYSALIECGYMSVADCEEEEEPLPATSHTIGRPTLWGRLGSFLVNFLLSPDVDLTSFEHKAEFSREELNWNWTPAFLPWLVRHNEAKLTDLEAATDDEIDEVISQLPDDAREKLAEKHFDEEAHFVRYFFGCWIDGRWQASGGYSNGSDIPGEHWDMRLAAGLYRRFQG